MNSPVVDGTQVLTALHEMASKEVKHQVQGINFICHVYH